jgi:hypothetical protein
MPALKDMTCIEDLRVAARRKVPHAFFDYTEAGSSEQTLRANDEDPERIELRPPATGINETANGASCAPSRQPWQGRCATRRSLLQ